MSYYNFLNFQLKAAWIRVLASGVMQHGAAAYAAMPRLSCHLAYAAAVLPGPSHARHVGSFPSPHEAPRYVFLA